MKTLWDPITLWRHGLGNLGYLGFLGFTGFGYFTDRNPAWLLLFALFGLFGLSFLNRFLNRPIDELPDERCAANSAKARSTAFPVSLIPLVLISLAIIFGFATRELVILCCALGFAITLFAYCFFFWLFEKNDRW